MDALLRDYIVMIVELCPVLDKDTFFDFLKHFAVIQDYLVPERYYHDLLEYRSPTDTSETTRERKPIGSMQEIVVWKGLILYSVCGSPLRHGEQTYTVLRFYFVPQTRNVVSFYRAFQISL